MKKLNIVLSVFVLYFLMLIVLVLTGCATLTRDQGTMTKCASMCGVKGAIEYSHAFSSDSGDIKCSCRKD